MQKREKTRSEKLLKDTQNKDRNKLLQQMHRSHKQHKDNVTTNIQLILGTSVLNLGIVRAEFPDQTVPVID